MSDFILVPGLWLNGTSWSQVVQLLEQAGHRADPLTLPGMASRSADRKGITLADHVGAVVAAVDAAADPVIAVGHSVAASLVHAAVDARTDRVARAVYVGGFPARDGEPLGADFPAENGEVPLLEWSNFDDTEVGDLDEAARARFQDEAIPYPQRVLTEPLRLTDERRFQVPVTLLCPEFSPDDVRAWLKEDEVGLGELKQIRHVDYIDLPTGHWPQLTNPAALARALLDAADRTPGALP